MRDVLLPVVLPSMGESVTEGTVTGIRKSAGDRVEAGETLVDITTDKVDVEIPSPAAGRIARILVKDGETVAVGALLAEIDTSDSAESAPKPETAPAANSTVVEMPAVGASITQGTIRTWRRHEGDVVERDEVIVEIAAADATVEIPSPVGGHLLRIFAPEGATIAIGAPLCEIGDAPAAAAPRAVAAPAPSAAPATAPKAETPPAPAAPPAKPAAPVVHAPPGVRRLARENGVDLSKINGTGPAGVIRRVDLDAAAVPVPRADQSRPMPLEPGAAVTELKGPAAALVGAMEQSLSIPTATSFRTVSVGVLDERRAALNAALKSAGRPEKLSYTHLIAFALASAARTQPEMVAFFRRGEAGPQRIGRGVHLGLAVDTQRKDGSRFLVVPVIRDADALDFPSFLTAYESFVAKARDNKLLPDDFAGATITLTNPGGIGTVASVPRLMAGQGTIVAAGAIGYPPGFSGVAADRLRELGITKVMTLTSTYDHRVIQGAQSGEFLRRIDQLLAGADGFYEQIATSLGITVAPAAPMGAAIERASDGKASSAYALTLAAAAAAGMSLISRIRTHGHTAATLDPLGGPQEGDPVLDASSLGLDDATARLVPAATLRTYAPGDNLCDVLANLRTIYCSTIAYEVEHITSHEQRSWLRREIESGAHVRPLTRERKLELLDRLTRVEAFERYLRKAFLGQKTFSIEGLDAMVPILEELLHLLADDGVRKLEFGTAHRGRLALITHVVDRPYEEVLTEFEHAELRGAKAKAT